MAVFHFSLKVKVLCCISTFADCRACLILLSGATLCLLGRRRSVCSGTSSICESASTCPDNILEKKNTHPEAAVLQLQPSYEVLRLSQDLQSFPPTFFVFSAIVFAKQHKFEHLMSETFCVFASLTLRTSAEGLERSEASLLSASWTSLTPHSPCCCCCRSFVFFLTSLSYVTALHDLNDALGICSERENATMSPGT